MSADWKAGDRALCVRYGNRKPQPGGAPHGGPQIGNVYLVSDIADYWNGHCLGLVIAGLPSFDAWTGIQVGWCSTMFRKLVPACDRFTQEQGASL